jgi:hypothetical protein
MSRRRRLKLLTIILCAALPLSFLALRSGAARDAIGNVPAAAHAGEANLSRASADMAHAAANLWAALSEEQRAAAAFGFDDAERHNWHFVPRERKGVSWAQMNTTQRHLAYALLATGLSRRGYVDVATVMSLEEILAELERGRRGPKRDPELYYFTVFGTPGERGTWGWRFEGHHVALNFTIVDGRGVASAPGFLGANPHEVKDGPRKGLRTLAAEQDMGFALVRSLDEAQRKSAVFSEKAPGDIVTRNNRKADVGEPKGVTLAELKPDQQHMLRTLVEHYATRMRDELAQQDLAEIDAAGWDKVRFAWAGGTEPGVGHYYRLHGPTFLVEFDNTQNGANHVHTVWRDLKNDFGEDLLREHYERDHQKTN